MKPVVAIICGVIFSAALMLADAAAPRTIALVLDGTSSMPTQALDESTLGWDVGNFLRPDERLRIFGIGRTLWTGRGAVRASGDIDRDVFTYAKAVHKEIGPSPIWDQLCAVLDIMQAEPGAHDVIVYTDGRATDVLQPRDVIAKARLVGSRVSVLYYQRRPNPGEPDEKSALRNETWLESIARETGGRFERVRTSLVIPKASVRMLLQAFRQP